MPRPDPATDPRFVKNRWKPGQSGNPAGRTKKKSMEEVVRELLHEEIEGSSMTYIEALARSLLRDAVKGDQTARRLVAERLWPAPKAIDLIARRADDAEEAEVFPRADIASLSEEQQADLRKLAHQAIMASAQPLDAEYREIESGEEPEQ